MKKNIDFSSYFLLIPRGPMWSKALFLHIETHFFILRKSHDFYLLLGGQKSVPDSKIPTCLPLISQHSCYLTKSANIKSVWYIPRFVRVRVFYLVMFLS